VLLAEYLYLLFINTTGMAHFRIMLLFVQISVLLAFLELK